MSAPAPRHRSRPPASPPEPSASRRRSDTARSASSSDSFGSSSARAGAGLRPAARRLRPVLAAALLFLPLLASLPEVAQGQTTFVKNTGQTTIGNTLRAFTRDTAQAFTTGSSATGYKLTSVVFKFHTLYNDPPSFTVAIHADSSGSPGSSLGTLTNPALTAGSNQKFTFTASGQGIDLAANTQYWIVIDNTSTNVLDTAAGWAITASDSEDAGAASGWSIANNSADRASSSTGSFTTDADALQLEIVGVANADLATSVTLSMSELSTSTLRLLETGSATYTVVLDAEPTADVTMTITKGGTHTDAANVNPTSHTFTSGTNGTWNDPVTITVAGVDQNTGGNRNRNRELTLSHAFASTDSRYNNISRSLAVKVDDAPEVEAWEGWVWNHGALDPNRKMERPRTVTSTPGLSLGQDIVAGPLDYVIRLSNRPETGGTVTVTATVGDSNLAGISLTRDGAPQNSLTLTFSDRDPSPHCDNSHHDGGGEDHDNTPETSWQCWRKVWVHDLAAGKTGVLGCTDITHTASGGGVRGMTGPYNWSVGTIRAHMHSQSSNGQEYRCPLITGKGSDPGMGATSNSPLQVSGPPTDPVSNLQLAAVDASSAKATWDAVAGAAGYRVEWEAADGLNVVAGVQDGVTETA
ncbi:MAG: hypothetical protein F4195_14470, partial [Gammaproteobacteria bacterium]|nr:hypothetical protein [Gammaproteobacteria bacterium]